MKTIEVECTNCSGTEQTIEDGFTVRCEYCLYGKVLEIVE